MILLISYDLVDEKDYDKVKKAIVDAPPAKDPKHSSHKALLSLWLVDSSSGPAAWYNHLVGATDNDDKIVVSRVPSRDEINTRGFKGTRDWLSDSARRW